MEEISFGQGIYGNRTGNDPREFSFVSLVQALGFWFGYGSGNVMVRALGAKNDKEAQIICADGTVLAVSTGLAVTLALLPFLRPLASFLGGIGGSDPANLS